MFEFVGQKSIIRELTSLVAVGAVDCVLLRGTFGHGKTTLAKMYASLFGPYLYYPVPPRDLTTIPPHGDTIIIDEIHRINDNKEEELYPLLENRRVVLCTTTTGGLSNALRSRCVELTMAEYSQDELAGIVYMHSVKEGIQLEISHAHAIARRAHGNPRVAVMLAKRLWRLIRHDRNPFNLYHILREFDSLGIDERGWDMRHKAYMRLLITSGRPIGLNSISQHLGLDVNTVQSEIEPALMKSGLITITRQGRKLCQLH